MSDHLIGIPVKELTIGKAAIAGLMRQIVEEVKEAEAKVEEENKKGLISVIGACAEHLQDLANGLPADKDRAKYLLGRCMLALGMQVDDDGLEL